jgi:hypothetical protein
MKLNKNIAVSETGLLFNPVTGESYAVNPIGVEILEMLKEGVNEAEIARRILDKYATEEATFEKDYQDFMTILHHHNLLARHAEANA